MGATMVRTTFLSSTPAVHRNAIAAVDTGTPAAASFAKNDYRAGHARLWITVSFVGGSSPKIDVTPWFKAYNSTTLLSEGTTLQYSGSDGYPAGSFMAEVEVNGMDVFAYIDNVSGSPTSFEVTITVEWF